MMEEKVAILNKIIEENWDQELKTLKELVGIKSIASELKEEDSMPFGEGVHRAFSYVLEKGEAMGFETKNVDNYGGHVEFPGLIYDEGGILVGTSEETMGIICHLDTVPEGNHWNHDPFSCDIEDGYIYGRGVLDDKGPAIASLYAMKAVKDAGIIPKTNVRLILGLDEETNWQGMDYYLSNETSPDFGFTPDGDFPVVNGEKGILVFKLAKKFGKTKAPGLELRSLKGGFAPNMVADSARAVIFSKIKDDYEFVKAQADLWKEEGRGDIKTKMIGKSMEIVLRGVSAHGSRPEFGVNAISKMMKFLGELTFINDDQAELIEFYNNCIGEELDGVSLGCGFSDEISGGTVLNVGMAEVDDKAGEFTINVRYPVTMKGEDIYVGIAPKCLAHNVGIIKDKNQEPIYIEENDPMIKTLTGIYQRQTGDRTSKNLIIGGGTYARAFKNVVAFGALFPDGDDCAHQSNERIKLDEIKKMTMIYAEAIVRLTGGISKR